MFRQPPEQLLEGEGLPAVPKVHPHRPGLRAQGPEHLVEQVRPPIKNTGPAHGGDDRMGIPEQGELEGLTTVPLEVGVKDPEEARGTAGCRSRRQVHARLDFQERPRPGPAAGARSHVQGIARAVPGWRWEPVVRALMALRGFALLHAATLLAELGDFNRFSHPAQLMNYLGLVPSENSTGDQRCQGGITKTGNAIARRALVEAAWQYRSPARLSPHLKKRQEGLPKAVTDTAWEAQRRLHHRYVHLTRVGKKKSQVAVTAVARELAGFVWAIACQIQPIVPKA